MSVTEDRLPARPETGSTDLDDEWARRQLQQLEREWARDASQELERRELEGSPARPSARAGTEIRLDRLQRWTRRLLAAWALVLTPLFLLAPAPEDPDASLSGPGLLVTAAFIGAFFWMLLGLGSGAKWGFKASAAAASIGVIAGIACAATGHHDGAWWAYEAGAFGGLVAFTGIAARRARDSREPHA